MRSNPGISPRRRHALPADAAGGRAAIWKTMLVLFLAITLAFWLPAAPTEAQPQASRTYVSGVGKDTNACTAAAPCLTLQTALAQTAPGGAIYSLDSANYGYVTINKAVSILAGRGATGVLATSNLSGVTINAGANDVINLQGLDIDGAGSGVSGIEFYSGASLNLQDSVIRGFTNGINFHPGGSSTLLVSRTLISNNSTGITFRSAGTTTAVLNDVQIVNNSTGITALGASASALANVTIQSSIVANNSTVGVAAGAYSAVTIANSTVTNNFAGLQAQAASSLVQVSRSNVTGNRTAWQTTNGGQITSASQNSFGGNTSGDTAPPTASPPPPTVVAKNIVTEFGARCDGVANDNDAFTAFNTWGRAQTLPIVLTIPSGSVCMFSNTTGSSNWLARGLKNLLVIGYGATISDNNGTGNGFFLAGFGVFGDNLHSSRVATVAEGATTVTLNNPSESARFKVGNWALMAGLDMMGYGYPPNAAFFEYVQITAINSDTGVITFAAPLKNSYESTWPLYDGGNDYLVDQGGPATLYALDPSWDTQVEYRGLTISQAGQTYATGRSVTYRDVTFTGSACGVPTQNMTFQLINTSMSACDMEVDKLIDTLVFNKVTVNQVLFQSASVNLFTMDGSTVTSTINGTPIEAVISNSTIANFSPGAYAYGRTKAVTCTNCVISALTPLGIIDLGGAGVDNSYSMSGGVITVPRSFGTPQWYTPGTALTWHGQYPHSPQAFVITDVTADATNTYVKTSLTGGFPSIPLGSGHLGIQTHPAPSFTCVNCSGSFAAVSVSDGPAGVPLGSYFKYTYTGNTTSEAAYLWGTLVSAKFNVTAAYTGASVLNFNIDSPFAISPDGVAAKLYSPVANPNLSGLRTVAPSTVKGSQPGDSLGSAPGAIWLVPGQITPRFNTDISTQNPATWPVVTIEIITDQNIQ